MSADITIDTKRPYAPGETLFLVGPGGVGKSTLGRVLADRLGWPLIDLDLHFCDEIEEIGAFIAHHGYAEYRAQNLALAQRLIKALPAPTNFVTASGFLAAPLGSDDRAQADALITTGFSIALLPSFDIDRATALVVERQLQRGFGLERASETAKFRERFDIYREVGDMLVVSAAPAEQVAMAVLDALGLKQP